MIVPYLCNCTAPPFKVPPQSSVLCPFTLVVLSSELYPPPPLHSHVRLWDGGLFLHLVWFFFYVIGCGIPNGRVQYCIIKLTFVFFSVLLLKCSSLSFALESLSSVSLMCCLFLLCVVLPAFCVLGSSAVCCAVAGVQPARMAFWCAPLQYLIWPGRFHPSCSAQTYRPSIARAQTNRATALHTWPIIYCTVALASVSVQTPMRFHFDKNKKQ